jgi:hypothetical protein
MRLARLAMSLGGRRENPTLLKVVVGVNRNNATS